MTNVLIAVIFGGGVVSVLWGQIIVRQSRAHIKDRCRWMQELEDMEQLIDDVRERARERGQRV